MTKEKSKPFMLQPWRWPQNPIWLKRYDENRHFSDSAHLWHKNDRWTFQEEGQEEQRFGGSELVGKLLEEGWVVD